MPFPESKEFTDKVLKHVKFKYDHEIIRRELNEHIKDLYDDLIADDITEADAQKLAIEFMGNADDIGEELNKVHNPVIGHIWLITRVVAIFAIIMIAVPAFEYTESFIRTQFFTGYDIKHDDAELIYSIKCDNKTKIDDMNIQLEELLYYDNGELEIRYRTWKDAFSTSIDWSFDLSATCVKDEKGNTYFSSGGGSNGGVISKHQMFINDFPEDAEKLIIDYNYYGRKIYFEVPLEEGENTL
ncbi:hypothetical protein SDC9_119304 [bioreactor metagenome]|uniref:Uncharacterized protein n=1 Tax=bioreactor metagenome TaxID=1076179 RepID=A0A645C5S8_9ZZZZ|nr:permease prefix domain 1-containing protein [Candidatus Metalachnospira sp.]